MTFLIIAVPNECVIISLGHLKSKFVSCTARPRKSKGEQSLQQKGACPL